MGRRDRVGGIGPEEPQDVPRCIPGDLVGRIGQNMEMHVLPQPALFALAAAEGMEVLEMRDDTAFSVGRPDRWVSNMFCFRRRPDLRPGLGTLSGLG